MNSQAFTPEEVEQGLLQDLLNYLLEHNRKNTKGYYDIHITSDGYCTIVEWVDIMYNSSFEESKFVLLKPEEYIMEEVKFPDGHYEMLYPDEAEDKLKEWHENHPEWVKTEYGTWTNMEENRRFAIDCNFKTWMERKVEENDSTFTESLFEPSTPTLEEPYTLDAAICSVDESILRRTDYVVVSKKIADCFFKYSGERSDGSIEKLDDIVVTNELHKLSKDPIHVYVTNYLTDDAIYYLTDSNYLIHRLKIEKRAN